MVSPISDLRELAEVWPARRIQRAVFISEKYRYVYVANPKVACTTIKLFLSRAELEDPEFEHSHIHQRKNNPLLRPSDLSRFEILKVMTDEYLRFTFVRHPVHRTVSAYLNKMKSKGDHPRKREILRILGKETDEDWTQVSFEEFLTALSQQHPSEMDPHWQPQIVVTAFNQMKYDVVGKLEEFDLVMKELRASLRLPEYVIEKKNVRRSKIDAMSLVTPRARRLIREIYEEDFETFGYDVESVVEAKQ